MDSYIALDLETTGLSSKTDRILEIGAIRIIEGEEKEEYSTLVDPKTEIPERITELTGITGEMVKGMPDAATAVKKLVEFCEDLPILGHNILFDYKFVKHDAVNLGLTFEKDAIDTLKIARTFLAELPSRRLQALCEYYEIHQENAHRALDDARMAHRLYQCLKKDFLEGHEEQFSPKHLEYKVKKQAPVTEAQKRYLQDLIKYHRIEFDTEIDSLTKNEASRSIDKIISSYGRILK